MSVVVQKYGGSSVADVTRMKQVADRVMRTRRDGHDVVVVVSAMGDTTDELLALRGIEYGSRRGSPRPPDELPATLIIDGTMRTPSSRFPGNPWTRVGIHTLEGRILSFFRSPFSSPSLVTIVLN